MFLGEPRLLFYRYNYRLFETTVHTFFRKYQPIFYINTTLRTVLINNYTVSYKNVTLLIFFSTNSVKNRPIFVFINIHIFEEICNHTVVTFPTAHE